MDAGAGEVSPKENGWTRFCKWTANPGAAALITVLLAVVGAMGSAFSQEIRGATLSPCPIWRPSCQLDVWSSAFWVALLFTAGFFLIRQRELDRRRLRHETVLAERTDDLRELVLTMPPTDFLVRFSEHFELCEALAAGALQDREADRTKLIENTQAVLSTIAFLAKSFDGSDDRYAANLMTPIKTAELDRESSERLLERVRLREPDTAMSSFDAVLLLRTDLSASTDLGGSDPNVEDLALGVPKTVRTVHHEWRVLPGACRAYVEGKPNMVIDATRIVDELRGNGKFSDDVLEQARNHFSSDAGRLIQSFLSIPIYEPKSTSDITTSTESREADGRGRILAILNLHRNKPGMLRIDPNWAPPNRSLEQFLPVLEPFGLLLARLLFELRRNEAGSGASGWVLPPD